MIEWIRLTSDEIDAGLRRLPVIIPIGLIEAHGPHLPLSVDLDTAAYFSRRVAEETGAILAPMLSYGFADEMAGYPGTIGLRADTLIGVVDDIARHFCRSGFTNLIFLSGHGANRMPVELAFWRTWEAFPQMRAVYWNYWTEAGLTNIHHADQGETEIAMAVGTPARMDKVRDFSVDKPWYRLRSRAAIAPESGGINGTPSRADPENGIAMREQIVRVLSAKVARIIQDINEASVDAKEEQ